MNKKLWICLNGNPWDDNQILIMQCLFYGFIVYWIRLSLEFIEILVLSFNWIRGAKGQTTKENVFHCFMNSMFYVLRDALKLYSRFSQVLWHLLKIYSSLTSFTSFTQILWHLLKISLKIYWSFNSFTKDLLKFYSLFYSRIT